MNRNSTILIGLVALFLVGVGLTAYFLLGGRSAPAPAGGPNPTPAAVRSFVAARYIPPRTVITADMLTESSAAQPVAGAITDVDQVVGKLAQEPIQKGQVVTAAMTKDDLERVIPATFRIPRRDLRAVGIWVDPLQTAAGLVDKGDRVDVIAAHKLKLTGNNNTGEIVSGRTIAQDLEVLGVDRSLNVVVQPTPAPAAPGAPPGAQTQPTPPPAPTPPPQPGQRTFTRVVVAAPPEVAERLVAANMSGELHITIRDPQTREAFPIAEAREYPAQSTDPLAQKVREAAVQDAIEARRRERQLAYNVRERREMTRIEREFKTTTMPDPNLKPAPVVNYPTPTPNVHEITVVRGTEKTRVVVPR